MNRYRLTAKILLTVFIFSSLSVEAGQNDGGPGQAEISSPEGGKPAGEEGLTLPMAVQLALQNSPRVKATLSGREMMDAQVRESKARIWPLLQFSETFTRSTNPVFVFGSLRSRAGLPLRILRSIR